jgi:hypothetical protein
MKNITVKQITKEKLAFFLNMYKILIFKEQKIKKIYKRITLNLCKLPEKIKLTRFFFNLKIILHIFFS